MKNIVLCDSTYDYKYQNIFGRISGIQIVERNFLALLKHMVKQKSFYHIRYFGYRGFIKSLLKIFLISLFSKFSGSKIIWTCHNIYEHSISSKKANDFMRMLLSFVSFRIVVFHKDLIKCLPESSHKKIIVASFGEYKSFIENRQIENLHFWAEYVKWLKLREIKSPDILSISAAKRNNITLLLQKLRETNLNALIIAPNLNYSNEIIDDNTFIYSNDFVEKEIQNIITSDKIIGYVGHDNISVPTSIYMYASYGIPIIGTNINPVNTIINEYRIGEVITEEFSIEEISNKILSNYSLYSENCQHFISENSWERSAEAHKSIFQ